MKRKLMDQRRSMNSSRRNIKEILLGHITSRLLKTSDKRKLQKQQGGEKDTVYAEEQNKHQSRLPVRNITLRQQKSNTFTIKTKPNPVSLEFYTKNIFQNEDKTFQTNES